ncbi:hypothetical protein SAMN04244559_00857 [Magnetospirillum fulvum]|uniref:Uncharacterized protein n=1 Tax=Magnetospirillum fulvum TaxID=1082 RepID=A0A1H6H2Z7_MAGFU|nr:hypothetical protein SAMN04244559_00857 [Magnetospirillum fulvum]
MKGGFEDGRIGRCHGLGVVLYVAKDMFPLPLLRQDCTSIVIAVNDCAALVGQRVICSVIEGEFYARALC